MYADYKQARNAAWKSLLDCHIDRLPVDLNQIAGHYHIPVVCYSEIEATGKLPQGVEGLDGDGFAGVTDGFPVVYLNDQIHHRPRRRFTVAHELGHVILGHPLDRVQHRNSERDAGQSPMETQANIFARDLLMPACVLAALGVHTPEEIMRLCDISHASAVIRAERLRELYRRDVFGAHPLERQVMARFAAFIRQQEPQGSG